MVLHASAVFVIREDKAIGACPDKAIQTPRKRPMVEIGLMKVGTATMATVAVRAATMAPKLR
jgi:hypothetical protein